MRIKLLETVRAHGRSYPAGSEIDVSDAEAEKLIYGGWAEPQSNKEIYVEPALDEIERFADSQKKKRGRPPK